MVPDGCPLTDRQFEVFALMAEGFNGVQAGQELGIAVSTLRLHIEQGMKALGVRTSRQAVVVMSKRGWFGWEPARASLKLVARGYIDALDRCAAGDPTAEEARDFYGREMRRLLEVSERRRRGGRPASGI